MADFSIQPGVVRGSTSNMAPGRWFDTNLIRWRGGAMAPIGGWNKITGGGAYPSVPRALLGWRTTAGLKYQAVGCDAHLWVQNGDVRTNITPSGFAAADVPSVEGGYGTWTFGIEDYGDGREAGTPSGSIVPFRFSLDSFGQILLANSSADGRLLYWDPSASMLTAAVVAGAPTGIRAMCVTAERAVVVLTDKQVSWSSREDYTDWNFASTTNTAGFLPAETPGTLRACFNVREGVLIFSETDVFLLRFVGDPFIYSLDKIGEGITLLGPNAVATFNGRAIWRGREGFYMYDGGYVKPLPSEISDYVDKQLDPGSFFRTFMSGNGVYPEVWGFFPSVGALECDRYFIYNYEEGWWGLGRLQRTAMIPAGIEPYPFMADATGFVYQHEDGDAFTSVGAGEIYAESGAVKQSGAISTITQIIPDSEDGASKTKWTFYTRMTFEGPETVKGPYFCRSDGYLDVRFTARSMRVRITATAGGEWTIGVPEYTTKSRGLR
jgi:hypothetical protein